jgi:hypothetical protein
MRSARKTTRRTEPHAPATPETKDLPVTAVRRPEPDEEGLPSIIRTAVPPGATSPKPTAAHAEGEVQP